MKCAGVERRDHLSDRRSHGVRDDGTPRSGCRRKFRVPVFASPDEDRAQTRSAAAADVGARVVAHHREVAPSQAGLAARSCLGGEPLNRQPRLCGTGEIFLSEGNRGKNGRENAEVDDNTQPEGHFT